MATPHKFWRVVFSTSTGGTSTSLWLDEVVFRDAASTDLCVGGAPSASSVWSGTYPVAHAFDKTTATVGWCSAQAQFPCWVGYEFADPVDVARVDLTLPTDQSASDELPVALSTSLAYSDDGVNYTPLIFTLFSGITGLGSTVSVAPIYFAGDVDLFPGMLSAVVARPLEHTPLWGEVLPDMQAAIRPLAFGPGRLSGTLKVLTVPSSREVRLHDRNSGQLLRTTLSATDGTYAFNNLQLGRKYLVIGLDDAGQAVMRNPGVADMQEAGA